MKALILAAGYGTRLYSLVKDTPKVLLPIRERPLIDYILDRIQELKDLDEVYIVTNNKFDQHLQDWSLTHKDYPHPIKVFNDQTNTPDDRLGSIGDIQFVLDHHDVDDDLLVVGGDNLFNFNLQDYLEFAQNAPDRVAIGLYDIGDLKDATKFGVVSIDGEGRVTLFQEKPEKPQSTLVAMCFYYFSKNTLTLINEYLKATQKSDRAGDYIKWLLDKTDVYGFKFSGKWYDIGSVEAYQDAQKNFS